MDGADLATATAVTKGMVEVAREAVAIKEGPMGLGKAGARLAAVEGVAAVEGRSAEVMAAVGVEAAAVVMEAVMVGVDWAVAMVVEKVEAKAVVVEAAMAVEATVEVAMEVAAMVEAVMAASGWGGEGWRWRVEEDPRALWTSALMTVTCREAESSSFEAFVRLARAASARLASAMTTQARRVNSEFWLLSLRPATNPRRAGGVPRDSLKVGKIQMSSLRAPCNLCAKRVINAVSSNAGLIARKSKVGNDRRLVDGPGACGGGASGGGGGEGRWVAAGRVGRGDGEAQVWSSCKPRECHTKRALAQAGAVIHHAVVQPPALARVAIVERR